MTNPTPLTPHYELLARGFLFEQQFAKVAVLHKGALSLYRHPSTGLFATLLTYGDGGWDLMLSVDHTNRLDATWEAVDATLACAKGLSLEDRLRAARDPETSPDALAGLATDEDWGVRKLVAGNRSTPPGMLEGLTVDPSLYVRRCAIANPSTPFPAPVVLADPSSPHTPPTLYRGPGPAWGVRCPACDGSSLRDGDPCSRCDGTGRVSADQ